MFARLRSRSPRPSSVPSSFISLRSSSSLQANTDRVYRGNRCIGVVREVYSKWERRTPLCPQHVNELVRQGYRVLVQPSERRIYSNEEFTQSGAVVTDSLSDASVLLGVKQPPVDTLLPDRTYLFFSHTIKAQPENMALLDAVLAKRIRLIDYECITSTGVRTGRRLVAFGRYAGIAGCVDILQGLGQSLLARGYSTPFVNSPTTYMYQDLESAKEGVKRLGQRIMEEGISPALSPLVFAFTGSGNVSRGAQEIFSLLPHEWVSPGDLPSLVEKRQGDGAATHKVYGTVVTDEHFVERIGGGPFDKEDYRRSPEKYRAVFHERVAPFVSVLVNGIYYDHRYPPLLTKAQMRELALAGRCRLLAVSDVSCDVEGSLEFVSRSTEIEKPFVSFVPETGQVSDSVDGKGIVVGCVDILPSELPKEASMAFGDALLPLLPYLASSEGYEASAPLEEMNADLPAPLQGACIAVRGELTKGYEYITFLRKEREREKKLRDKVYGSSTGGKTSDLPLSTLTLDGHLFDSGLINKVLDLIEARGGSFHISECIVRPNKGLVKNTSTVVVEVEAQTDSVLQDIAEKVRTLVSLLESAEATVTEVRQEGGAMSTGPPVCAGGGAMVSGGDDSGTKVTSRQPRKVLVLGAGRVAGPAIGYLGKDATRQLTIVGATEKETSAAAGRAKWTKGVVMDVAAEKHRLASMVGESDLVVSLLPAGLHADVAELCVEKGVSLVTSSYVSDAMKALHHRAEARGVMLLNEAGLDPGMDHLSAMRIIDDAKARGGSVVRFRSVCGGLPAPEAADNPFHYKFSWSPRAVLTAAQQAATYKMDGVVVKVDGQQLLQSATPLDEWTTLRLEALPNRNSLIYGDLYGIPDAATIFRGTLRYQGWSCLMHGCRSLGLFDDTPVVLPGGQAVGLSWRQLMAQVVMGPGGTLAEEERGVLESAIMMRLGASEEGESSGKQARDVVAALEWLGAFSKEEPVEGTTVADAFVSLLEKRLRYEEDERDMVVMRHDIDVALDRGQVMERHTSTLLAYGDGRDSAMARTVGLTCAMAAEMVLNDKNKRLGTGVVTPLSRVMYEPLLAKLATEGLAFKETTTTSGGGGSGGGGEEAGQGKKVATGPQEAPNMYIQQRPLTAADSRCDHE